MSADSGASTKFWTDKKVLVTGGAGFIGGHLVERLLDLGASVSVADNIRSGHLSRPRDERVRFLSDDLLEPESCQLACHEIDVVFNAAAKVAGVGYNSAHPGEMFYRNSVINLNMLDAARKSDVARFVVFSSACVYQHDAPVPTSEENGFIGDPEPTNFGYGWAKRLAEVQARAYASEYGMKISIIRPYNSYGPWDHFDDSAGHVIPNLIRKINSDPGELVVWGSGKQRRSFVYVSDLVEGLVLSPERYPIPDPVNVGSEEETTIAELTDMIMRLSGQRIPVKFDLTKPEGQLRRKPDLQKARKLLGYSPKVPLEQGLSLTLNWYGKHIKGLEVPVPKAHQR